MRICDMVRIAAQWTCAFQNARAESSDRMQKMRELIQRKPITVVFGVFLVGAILSKLFRSH